MEQLDFGEEGRYVKLVHKKDPIGQTQRYYPVGTVPSPPQAGVAGALV